MLELSAATALSLVERLASVGVAIGCLEILAYPAPLRDAGLMSWEVGQLRNRWLAGRRTAALLGGLLGHRATLVATALRLVAALALASGLTGEPLRGVCAAVVALATITFSLRSPFGLDGADQLSAFIFVGLTFHHAIGSAWMGELVLWCLALQVSLAYCTSGIGKVFSRTWRDGSAIPGVVGTLNYGSAGMAKWLAGKRGLAQAIAWTVILTETVFPLALIGPEPLTLALLVGGLAFHVGNAVVMGLNTFFWSFVATYPAVLYCAARLRPF